MVKEKRLIMKYENGKRILEFGSLKGREKVAILLNFLGEGVTKQVFANLDDNNIKKIVSYMNKYQIVPVDLTKRILEEFYEMFSENENFIFSKKTFSKELIAEAIGEDRVRGVLGSLNDKNNPARNLESLEMIDSKSLTTFLVNEHPQTIAVILAHLEPDKKGEVLSSLPEVIQLEVVMRLSQLEHVDPSLIKEVDKVLREELASTGTTDRSNLGGVQTVADMLNVLDKNTEQNILTQLEGRDPDLAEEIRNLMFVFEDLIKIDDKGMQSLLKEIPNDKLLLALKTANEDVKDKIFKNMSKRAAEMAREDLEMMGPSRVSDVEAAQSEIINIAKRLEQSGQIMVDRGGAEDALV